MRVGVAEVVVPVGAVQSLTRLVEVLDEGNIFQVKKSPFSTVPPFIS